VIPARAAAARTERLQAVPADGRRSTFVAPPLATDGYALVAGDGEHAAIACGNRSAVLPDVRAVIGDREWMLSVKGVGAASLPYGALPIDDELAMGEPVGRAIAAESWMGEAPYGAQGSIGAAQALEVTALADTDATIGGASICPVIAIVTVPEEHVRDVFWYRRHRGPYLQEHRLVPSDVRLYHGTGVALGRDPEEALRALGVDDEGAIDAFAERFLASGIAALTIWARTARERDGVLEGLDFDDAWLDKDAVLAADGTIFLVDLESLEWTPVTHRMSAAQRIQRQIDRNYYELMFGLDAILDVRDRWLERESDPRARRESIAARASLALAGDPFVELDDRGDTIDLCIRQSDDAPVRVRFLDRR
jgi:hypothetical protein